MKSMSQFHVKMFALILVNLLLAGCSNQLVVRTDFDKLVSVQQMTEYNWLGQHDIESRNNPLYYNELNDKRIKDRVDARMKAKGYILSTTKPKILLHYHFSVEERSVYRPEEYGYAYNRYWLDQRVNLIRYAEGTLIIDFMDATNCKLIWRGWATSVLDESRTMNEDLLNLAIDEILKRFPESAAKEIITP